MNPTLTSLLVLALPVGPIPLSTPFEKVTGSTTTTAAQEAGPFVPGPEHALLQGLVGTWNAVLILKDPTGAEQKTHGTLTTVRETDFHTSDRFEGSLMGMPMLGHGISGYCPIRKQHYRFWTDSMTPVPLVLWGAYDAGKRELVLSGECFGASGKLEPCRTVTRFVDDDHVTWTLSGKGPGGAELQILRIEYTRKK